MHYAFNHSFCLGNYCVLREYHKCVLPPLTWMVGPTRWVLLIKFMVGPTIHVMWEEGVRIYGIPGVPNNFPFCIACEKNNTYLLIKSKLDVYPHSTKRGVISTIFFTINHMWLVIIDSTLNLPLKLLFYPTNNNL